MNLENYEKDVKKEMKILAKEVASLELELRRKLTIYEHNATMLYLMQRPKQSFKDAYTAIGEGKIEI